MSAAGLIRWTKSWDRAAAQKAIATAARIASTIAAALVVNLWTTLSLPSVLARMNKSHSDAPRANEPMRVLGRPLILSVALFAAALAAPFIAWELSTRGTPEIPPEVLGNPELFQIAKDTIRRRLPGVSFPAMTSGLYWITNHGGKTCVMGPAFRNGESVGWSVLFNGKEPETLRIGGNEPEPVPK